MNGKNADSVRQSRKVTMMDLLLLLVMMGVLIPLALRLDQDFDVGPYKVRFEEHQHKKSRLLTLKITLPRKAEATGLEELVGWRIFDDEGILTHEEYDLPPLSGQSREFHYMVNVDKHYGCEITTGSENLYIQIPRK